MPKPSSTPAAAAVSIAANPAPRTVSSSAQALRREVELTPDLGDLVVNDEGRHQAAAVLRHDGGGLGVDEVAVLDRPNARPHGEHDRLRN